MDELKEELKAYILKEFMPDGNPQRLNDSTPLITGGILGSLGTLKLVAFLEEKYGIAVEVQELDVERLNNIANIAAFVRSKT